MKKKKIILKFWNHVFCPVSKTTMPAVYKAKEEIFSTCRDLWFRATNENRIDSWPFLFFYFFLRSVWPRCKREIHLLSTFSWEKNKFTFICLGIRMKGRANDAFAWSPNQNLKDDVGTFFICHQVYMAGIYLGGTELACPKGHLSGHSLIYEMPL